MDRKSLKRKYTVDPDESIEWLELSITVVCIVALSAVYILLPQNAQPNSALDLLKACLPNAITALVVVPVVFFVLKRAGLSSDQKLYRAVVAALSHSKASRRYHNDVAGLSAEVLRILSALKPNVPIEIRILAYTGATFTTALLRDVIELYPHRTSIDLHIMDFDAHSRALFPVHWPQEANDTEARLIDLCRDTVQLKIHEYRSFPFVLGLEVNGEHLFLAFPDWAKYEMKIADKSLEYVYYSKGEECDQMFRLFENWINQPEQILLVPKSQSTKP